MNKFFTLLITIISFSFLVTPAYATEGYISEIKGTGETVAFSFDSQYVQDASGSRARITAESLDPTANVQSVKLRSDNVIWGSINALAQGEGRVLYNGHQREVTRYLKILAVDSNSTGDVFMIVICESSTNCTPATNQSNFVIVGDIQYISNT